MEVKIKMIKTIYWIIAVVCFIYLIKYTCIGEESVASVTKELMNTLQIINVKHDGFFEIFWFICSIVFSISWPFTIALIKFVNDCIQVKAVESDNTEETVNESE